jgi:hypothetical protein
MEVEGADFFGKFDGGWGPGGWDPFTQELPWNLSSTLSEIDSNYAKMAPDYQTMSAYKDAFEKGGAADLPSTYVPDFGGVDLASQLFQSRENLANKQSDSYKSIWGENYDPAMRALFDQGSEGLAKKLVDAGFGGNIPQYKPSYFSENRSGEFPDIRMGGKNAYAGGLLPTPKLMPLKNLAEGQGEYTPTLKGPFGELDTWSMYYSPEDLMEKSSFGEGGELEARAISDLAVGAPDPTKPIERIGWSKFPSVFKGSDGIKGNNWNTDYDPYSTHMGMAPSMRKYVSDAFPGFPAPGIAQEITRNINDELLPGFPYQTIPNTGQIMASERGLVKDIYRDLYNDPTLNPASLMSPGGSFGSLGSYEKDEREAIQSAWNDPFNALSLVGQEKSARQTLLDAEQSAVENFNTNRENVIGDMFTPGSLHGDIYGEKFNLSKDYYGSGGVKELYEGPNSQREILANAYGNYIGDKFDPQFTASYPSMRGDILTDYSHQMQNPDTGIIPKIDGDIQQKREAFLGAYPDSVEDLAHEKFSNDFANTVSTYKDALVLAEQGYNTSKLGHEKTRDEEVAESIKDWREQNRQLEEDLVASQDDTSLLRRQIRGFKGGNILSGRRSRRAGEEYNKAANERSKILAEQKALTDERRHRQSKARDTYSDDIEELNRIVGLEVEEKEGTAQEDIQKFIGDTESHLADQQGIFELDIAGPEGILKSGLDQKESLEFGSGPTSITKRLEDLNQETEAGIYDQARSLSQGIQRAREDAVNEVYGPMGKVDTYKTNVQEDWDEAELKGEDEKDSLSSIIYDREDYEKSIGGPTGALRELSSDIEKGITNLHSKYNKYDGPNSRWETDVKGHFTGGEGLQSKIAGGRSGLGRTIGTAMADYITPKSGTMPKWLPDAIFSGNKGLWSNPINQSKGFFGQTYNPAIVSNRSTGGMLDNYSQITGKGYGHSNLFDPGTRNHYSGWFFDPVGYIEAGDDIYKSWDYDAYNTHGVYSPNPVSNQGWYIPGGSLGPDQVGRFGLY